MPTSDRETLLAVDGHVHLHPGVDLGRAFDAALEHARRASGERFPIDPGGIVLCLVDPEQGARFSALRSRSKGEDLGDWRLRSTEERGSLLAERDDGARAAVVAGRQVRTADGFEVLLLASTGSLPAGEPLETTVRRGASRDDVVVVAWGFGKWWFRRGNRLRSLLRSPVRDRVFIGDNAGRLACGPHLGLLREARRRSVPILPGSDPLPLPGHEQRVGQYGFLVSRFDLSRRPAAMLRSRIRSLEGQPRRYGSLDPPHRALLSQLQLRLPRFR